MSASKVGLSKAQAIIAMRDGHKVTHDHFTSGEWMTFNPNGTLLFEDGISCSMEEFFHFRKDEDGWDYGYSLI